MSLKFKIKKAIITSHIRKKKKNNPFNVEASELFELNGSENIMVNNSYFFGGYSLNEQSALVMRLGLRNLSYSEVFVFYQTKDMFLVTPEDYYPKDQTPLKVRCITPGKTWEVNFDGDLLNKNDNTMHHVSFTYIYEAKRDIYDFFYSLENPYMIEATAKCKWDKRFQEEVGGNDQRHYEQTGHLKGTIIIDGNSSPLDMPAGRDHSFGTRDWNYMNDHIWLFAFDEKGNIFNYSLVNYPLLKNVNCGYTDLYKDKLVSLKKAKVVDYDANNGLVGEQFGVEILLEDGTKLNVTTNRLYNHETHYQNGDYYFQEGLGEVFVNGVKMYGSLEFGFNKDQSRWEIKNENI